MGQASKTNINDVLKSLGEGLQSQSRSVPHLNRYDLLLGENAIWFYILQDTFVSLFMN